MTVSLGDCNVVCPQGSQAAWRRVGRFSVTAKSLDLLICLQGGAIFYHPSQYERFNAALDAFATKVLDPKAAILPTYNWLPHVVRPHQHRRRAAALNLA